MSERHRSKERYEKHQHQSLGVEETSKDRGPHDHLPRAGGRSLVQRALERAPVLAPDVTPIEEALRRARAPAPAPAPRNDTSLGVEANPRNRESQENVSFESISL